MVNVLLIVYGEVKSLKKISRRYGTDQLSVFNRYKYRHSIRAYIHDVGTMFKIV